MYLELSLQCDKPNKIHRFTKLTKKGETKSKWATLLLSYVSLAEGQPECKENTKSKQTLALASDGMAHSLFPTILQNSAIDSRANQVVIKVIWTKCSSFNLIFTKISTFLAMCLRHLIFLHGDNDGFRSAFHDSIALPVHNDINREG